MRLIAGDYTADVDVLGAALRSLTSGGRDLVVPSGSDDPPGAFRGVVVAPWPNRVVDGRYRFAGVDHQLPVNETARGHALHGFAFDRRWAVVDESSTNVVLRLDLVPQPGYPFTVRLQAAYTLSAAGLHIELTARNTGEVPAPYGCTIHPYLTCGTPLVDDALLLLPADTRVEVDDRLAPAGTRSVESVDCDFRTGATIGSRRIDHAFTDLTADADGVITAQLRRPPGASSPGGVRMTWGPWARWVQVHTADRPEPDDDRVGLALEPMSCAADAFNSGAGLVVLDPGDVHSAWWGLSAVG